MPSIKIGRFFAAIVTMTIPAIAGAQYSPDTKSVIQRLRTDPRIPIVLQAIKEGYYASPDLIAAVNRCVTAAIMIPGTPARLQADACLRSMVGGLDPLSAYLSPQDMKYLTGSPGEGSVGLEIRKGDLGAEIILAIEGGPGAQAGIGSGTLIVAIDGQPTAPMSLSEIASVLRGPVGSIASLELIQPKSSEVLRVEVRRELVRQASVIVKMIDERLGYVRIPRLSTSLAVELTDALQSLLILPLQPMRGIVLDLRDCTGGLLHGAIALAAAFLPDETVVMTMSSRREGERTYRAILPDASSKSFDPRPIFENQTLRTAAQKIPLIVLVNRGTASGAEAVVAALQESGRAYVMGQPTAGISSVQTLLPLKDHDAIKLTTEVMRSPSGRTWADHGIRPDFPVPQELMAHQGEKIADDSWVKLAAEHLHSTK